jgi:hypothetical protein
VDDENPIDHRTVEVLFGEQARQLVDAVHQDPPLPWWTPSMPSKGPSREEIDLALKRQAIAQARSRAFCLLLERAQFAYCAWVSLQPFAWVREPDEDDVMSDEPYDGSALEAADLELAEAKRTIEGLRKLVDVAEWSGHDCIDMCPWCEQTGKQPHFSTCPAAKVMGWKVKA